MFDSITTARGSDDGGRRLSSFALSAALLGGALAVAALAEPPPRLAEIMLPPMPAMVEVFLPEPAGGPPEPGRGGAGSSRPQPAPAAAREPPEVAPSEEPPPDVPASVLPTTEGGGSAAPTEGPPGGPGEPPGGPSGGGGSGLGDGEMLFVHNTDLAVLTRVEPRFPEAARSFGRREERCVVRVEVDIRGAPASVTPRSCPVVFQQAALDAAKQWRWSPYLAAGRPVSATFDLQFVFRLRD